MGLICLFTSLNGFREALAVNMSFTSGFIIIIIIIMVLMNIFEDGSKTQRIFPSQGYNTQHRNLRSRGYTSSTGTSRSRRYKLQRRILPNMRIQPAVQERSDNCTTRNSSGTGPPCLKAADEIHNQFKPHRERSQE